MCTASCCSMHSHRALFRRPDLFQLTKRWQENITHSSAMATFLGNLILQQHGFFHAPHPHSCKYFHLNLAPPMDNVKIVLRTRLPSPMLQLTVCVLHVIRWHSPNCTYTLHHNYTSHSTTQLPTTTTTTTTTNCNNP